MSDFNTIYNNLLNKKINTDEKINSINNFINFQNELTNTINSQYQKPWKSLSKDCKIKKLLEYCNINKFNNKDYLKKYINKLKINYDQNKMIIINIDNINKNILDDSTFNIVIIDLKNKPTSKKKLNQVEVELQVDI